MTQTTQNGWVETTLGDIVKINTRQIGRGFSFEKILYLDTGSITRGEISALQPYNIQDAPSRAKRLVEDGDIVYSSVRPDHQHFGLIKKPHDNLVVSTGFVVISPKKELADPWFIYYFLTQDKITATLQQIAEHSTSTYPSIKPESIEGLHILLPPLPEQRAIAAVLSSLDDKIELLREQNKTLEAMAQELFREWFTEFNFPDANGQPYKKSGGKMIDSELDEIPEGWTSKAIFEVADYINGASFKDSDFTSEKEGAPIIRIAELKNGLTSQTNYTKKEMAHKYYLHDDDILFSWSGSPETSIDIFIWDKGNAVLNQHIFKVVAKNEVFKTWLFFLLKNHKPFFIDRAKQKQTTGLGHVTISDLKNHTMPFPPREVTEKYDIICRPYFQKIILNLHQVRALSVIRDELLPRLMNREILMKHNYEKS